MSDDVNDLCLGPPCRHFPPEIKTGQEALDYLAYSTLRSGTLVNYVSGRSRWKAKPKRPGAPAIVTRWERE
jgi:hypothetical protein